MKSTTTAITNRAREAAARASNTQSKVLKATANDTAVRLLCLLDALGQMRREFGAVSERAQSIAINALKTPTAANRRKSDAFADFAAIPEIALQRAEAAIQALMRKPDKYYNKEAMKSLADIALDTASLGTISAARAIYRIITGRTQPPPGAEAALLFEENIQHGVDAMGILLEAQMESAQNPKPATSKSFTEAELTTAANRWYARLKRVHKSVT